MRLHPASDHRAPCREFASISKGEIKTHKERWRGGEEEREKERCSQPVHEINVGPNLRSFLRGKERYGQEKHRAPPVPDCFCAGGLILHTEINGRFATSLGGSRK